MSEKKILDFITNGPGNEPEKIEEKKIFNIPNMGVDPLTIDKIFEVGFRPQDNQENPFDVPEEILLRNRETFNHWVPIWLAQSSMLGPFILEDFGVNRRTAEMTKDANVDVASCEAARKDSAIIVATGPSLEKYLEAMKSYQGVIIASATALAPLVANGIIPHYAVAIDANNDIGDLLADAPYREMGIKLLVPPTVDWTSASVFEGSRFWFKSMILARNGINHAFNAYMTMFFPWIQNWIYQAGCVTNTMFLLTTLLNSRGNHDIKKVFLFGADFGYPEGLSRIQGYKYVPSEDCLDGKPHWLQRPRDSLTWRTRGTNQTRSSNGILTDTAMLGYKRSLYSIWNMQGCSSFKVDPEDPESPLRSRPCLYSCSEGILFELPRCDGNDVLSTSGDCVDLYREDVIRDTFKDYMRTTGKAEGQIAPDLKVP